MKKVKTISVIILLAVIVGCGGGTKQSTDALITVNVNESYPEKELILQDIMDVEYIPLETTDEFITHGIVSAVGEEYIIVRDRGDGTFFIFDRTGKGIRKINRLGQSGEEYSLLDEIILDEDNRELFIIDYTGRKILVYDLYGNYKRSFKFADDSYYTFTFNYDRENLITYKTYSPMDNENSGHVLISKEDGSITKNIPIPFKDIKTPKLITEEIQVMPFYFLTTPYSQGNWTLVHPSSDTIYTYSSTNDLVPLIVRTPSIHSMEKEAFLFMGAMSDRYYFMHTMKKEFDMTSMKGFPKTYLIYDNQDNAIYKYALYNDDYAYKHGVTFETRPFSHEIVTAQSLDAFRLVENYESEYLKGELKEIAAELDEEANPVIMLIKRKK